MQTLTIRTDETIMRQLIAIGKILASSANKSFETLTTELTDEYVKELNARADEALKGKGLIDEASARESLEAAARDTLEQKSEYPIYDDGKTMEQRITDYKADIEALRRGELKTYPLETLKAEMEKW